MSVEKMLGLEGTGITQVDLIKAIEESTHYGEDHAKVDYDHGHKVDLYWKKITQYSSDSGWW